MSKIIGLTGGIGSGKTTIANKFLERGIPIYNADERSKLLLNKTEVINEIKAIFGLEILNEVQKIDRKKLALIVFNQPEKLQKLNEILHPKVGEDFKNWVKENHKSSLLLKEAAILIESGSHKNCDYIILVTANLENRINRVITRDKTSRNEVIDRINNQWSDEEKMKFAHFVIVNDELEKVDNQIDEILKNIKELN
jgi:dephospho-CoA kinase